MSPRLVLLGLALLLIALPAHANAGIPMLAIAWPVHWLAFVPVVALEAELGVGRLGIPRMSAYKVAAAGNLASTLLGIPLAWVAMMVPTMVFGLAIPFALEGEAQTVAYFLLLPLMSGWLGPTDNVLVIYVAFLALSVPMCAASIYAEQWVAARLLPDRGLTALDAWVTRANLYSYACICTLVGGYALWLFASAP